MHFIGNDDIAEWLPIELAVRTIETGFATYDPNDWEIPIRTSMGLPSAEKAVLTMPLVGRRTGRIYTKLVLVHTGSASSGSPVATALCAVWDALTGELLLTADGTYLTALRTAATVAAAARKLARPNSSSLTLIGAGYQGRMQALALQKVLPITRCQVVDRQPEKAFAVAEELRRVCNIEASANTSVADAVGCADIVVTATNSCAPVFPGSAIRPGTHVSSIGSYRTDMRETDDDFIATARIYVDAREHAWAEVGDLLIPLARGVITKDAVVADLSELLRDAKMGRSSDREITFFKSAGFALQDALMLEALYEATTKHGSFKQVIAG